MSAEHHWTALDHTFSRLLPAAHLTQGRQRFARRAAALTDIYLRRFVNVGRCASGDRDNVTRQLLELQRVHRALTAALTGKWTRDP